MEHHTVTQPLTQRGFTLLEVLIGLAIFSIVIGSVYSGYTNIIDIISKTQYSSAAISVIESRVEMVRNMRYEDVGVIQGVPAGTLVASEQVFLGTQAFTLSTTVRDIDDPFDGVLGGSPVDLNPADYKLVQFDMICEGCTTPELLTMATIVAPKTFEDTSRNGSLEITVIDASGQPIPQASLHIVNAAASINLTTTTNNEGKLMLLSVATGSTAYEITATKPGYSTDRTYPPNDPANAVKPHVTVATQQLTLLTMVIDRVSSLSVQVRDRFCTATGPFNGTLIGNKLIGVLPDVPKYDNDFSVSAGGLLNIPGLEWDTYTAIPTDLMYELVGMSIPLSFALDPADSQTITWVIAPHASPSALIRITDSTGAGINAATVHLAGTAYDRTSLSGFWQITDTDWSGGNVSEISENLDATTEGILTLAEQGGIYATGSAETLTSTTFDLGTSVAQLQAIHWNPHPQPSGTSARFQIAANSDNTTWNFIGPDGTDATFFEIPGQLTPPALNAKRYIRYRAFLETTNSSDTPSIQDVSISFTSACLLDGHTSFDGLTPENIYTVNVNAPGYLTASQSFSAQHTWTQIPVTLTPQ